MENLVLRSLRSARDEKLKTSDIDMLRALERDDQTAISELRVYRQALRDFPTLIDDPWTEDSEVPQMPLSPSEQAAVDYQSDEEE